MESLLIDIAVFDGFDELDALGPLEVFRTAADYGADVRARLVTGGVQDVVRAAHGLRVQVDGRLVPGRADVLLVPGGGWTSRSKAGAWAEAQRGVLPAQIAAAAGTTRVLAGVCTGVLLLAHAGVVGTRRAATHHGARAELAATGATVLTDRVVDDGDLVTCGGVTSGIDMALWLVERELGTDTAEQVAAELEYQRVRPAPVPAR